MRKFIPIIGTAFVLWMQVIPNGEEYCGRNPRNFNYHPQTESGYRAGVNAQAEFCKMISR